MLFIYDNVQVSSPDPKDDVPYSFLCALEEEFFHDLVIKADTGKEVCAIFAAEIWYLYILS